MFRCNAVNLNEQVPIVSVMTFKASKTTASAVVIAIPFKSLFPDSVDQISISLHYISAHCRVLQWYLALTVSLSSIETAGHSSC